MLLAHPLLEQNRGQTESQRESGTDHDFFAIRMDVNASSPHPVSARPVRRCSLLRQSVVPVCRKTWSVPEYFLLGVYALMIKAELSMNSIIVAFGLLIAVTMASITIKHWHDQDQG